MLLQRSLLFQWEDLSVRGYLPILLSPEATLHPERWEEYRKEAERNIVGLSARRVDSRIKPSKRPHPRPGHIPAEMYLLKPQAWARIKHLVVQLAREQGITPNKFIIDQVRAALYLSAGKVISGGKPAATIERLRHAISAEVAREVRQLAGRKSEADRIENARAAAAQKREAEAAAMRAALEPERRAEMMRRARLSEGEARALAIWADGSPPRKIAMLLNRKPSTVRTWLMRALGKLHSPSPLLPEPASEELAKLTPREREIWLLRREGLRPRQIASRLGIKPATVRALSSWATAKLAGRPGRGRARGTHGQAA